MQAEHDGAYHNANQYISALPFPHQSKSSLCLGTNTPFTNKVYVFCVCEYVLNVNGKMCISVVFSVYPYVLFSHVFFFFSLTTSFPDSFCLSLQLEVLHSQTLMLIRERWGDLVQEERYVPAKYLTLTVWK